MAGSPVKRRDEQSTFPFQGDAESREGVGAVRKERVSGTVRLREPKRAQSVVRFETPATALAETHPARVMWRVLETLDLSAFSASSKAYAGRAGRPVHSPRMLLCLWLYGVSQGIGSARELARRVQTDVAFAWIAGDVRVSHDVLTRFRVRHPEAFQKLMTDVIAVLLERDLLDLTTIAIDGTRVRASASAPSFRKAASLEDCREQARLHLRAVLAETASVGERAARIAAARAYEKRVEEAIETARALAAQGKQAGRASTTDPEARVMKMADGGFRPAYNVQLATVGSPLGGARTIVGARVTQNGDDHDAVIALVDQVRDRTGRYPETVLADGGCTSHDTVEALDARGIEPLLTLPDHERRASVRQPRSQAVADWRALVQTDDAKRRMRARGSLAELPNARLKSRLGLAALLVRSVGKATTTVLLVTIAHNLLAHGAALFGS